jgi:transcriptional regulator with XRE-family HTH domain
MPDPLCRLHGISVVIGREHDGDDLARRLVAPHEARLLRRALGLTVRQLRGIRGLSQERLGQDAGLHRNYIGAIERGEINATLRVLCKVGYGLRVPTSDLLVVAEGLAAERRRAVQAQEEQA